MKPYFHAAARVLLFIGGNLLAGSALAFAALNQGARVQDGAFFYWQRCWSAAACCSALPKSGKNICCC